MNKELFKALRHDKGLTQKAYGERLGITGNTVSKIERGEARITDRIRIAVAQQFPITHDFLETYEAAEKLKSF